MCPEFPEFLTRDSRTVVVPKYFHTCCSENKKLCDSMCSYIDNFLLKCTCEKEQSEERRHKSQRRRLRRRQDLRFNIKRLADFIVISTYLLSIVPATTSSPLPLQAMDPVPRWTCPCGSNSEQEIDNDFDLVTAPISDRELLEHIVLQATIALDDANRFKHSYVSRTFGAEFEDHHRQWGRNQLSWLPDCRQIPKKLGETVENQHLEQLAIENALRDIYEYLQKIAVGLEQVVIDQRNGGDFADDFNRTNNNLMQVLCEIQMAMRELIISPKPDVTRDIMDENVRDLSSLSHRNVRDWLIFRDYMNGLEYVIQVFEYIKERL